MATTWQPTASIENLESRSRVLWRIREFFHSKNILEVQVPTLSHDTVLDRHIDPIVVEGNALGLSQAAKRQLYLQTSPEFGMKRLLAAGMKNIYQISSVFRAGERGHFHNPEFTMVEWYRAGDQLTEATGLLADLVMAALSGTTFGSENVMVVSYRDAFLGATGLDPLDICIADLARFAVDQGLGVDLTWSNDKDQWLDLIFSDVVQPVLGQDCPAIVTHYPASQSALAQISKDDPRAAERFELFIHGIELANGYHELLDANELRSRNERVASQRLADGKQPLPASSQLLDAMSAGLPSCSGCALGLDRLMMVALGARTIDEVIPFPIERA